MNEGKEVVNRGGMNEWEQMVRCRGVDEGGEWSLVVVVHAWEEEEVGGHWWWRVVNESLSASRRVWWC